MDVDFEELTIFLETLEGSGFTHFIYEKGDLRIEVSKQPLDAPSTHAPRSAGTSQESVSEQTRVTSAAPEPAKASEKRDVPPQAEGFDRQPGDIDVAAPLLGTVYLAPKPGASPFVELGSAVSAGETLCIIEVMKLMNSVEAPVSGTIVACHFGDGELVEFGQAVFTIRPAGN